MLVLLVAKNDEAGRRSVVDGSRRALSLPNLEPWIDERLAGLPFKGNLVLEGRTETQLLALLELGFEKAYVENGMLRTMSAEERSLFQYYKLLSSHLTVFS
eukprot:5446306-Amphidinium_carterae.1